MHALIAVLLNHLEAAGVAAAGTGLGGALGAYLMRRAKADIVARINDGINALEAHLAHSQHPQDAIAVHAVAAAIACRLPDDSAFAKDGAALLVSEAPRLKPFQPEIEEALKVIVGALKANFERMQAQAAAPAAAAQPPNDVPHS